MSQLAFVCLFVVLVTSSAEKVKDKKFAKVSEPKVGAFDEKPDLINWRALLNSKRGFGPEPVGLGRGGMQNWAALHKKAFGGEEPVGLGLGMQQWGRLHKRAFGHQRPEFGQGGMQEWAAHKRAFGHSRPEFGQRGGLQAWQAHKRAFGHTRPEFGQGGLQEWGAQKRGFGGQGYGLGGGEGAAEGSDLQDWQRSYQHKRFGGRTNEFGLDDDHDLVNWAKVMSKRALGRDGYDLDRHGSLVNWAGQFNKRFIRQSVGSLGAQAQNDMVDWTQNKFTKRDGDSGEGQKDN